MSDPISSVSPRDISWIDQPSDRDDFRETLARRLDERTYGVCHDPATVIGAALCDDQAAAANACRRAQSGSVDEFLCDDPALQKVQDWFADVARKAFELMLGAKAGRSK
jgi:hypothetical protein